MVPSPSGDKFIVPYIESGQLGSSQSYRVLQYDNGYLSLRPRANHSRQMWVYNDSGPIGHGVKSCTLINDNIQDNNVKDRVENENVHNQYRNQLNAMLGLIQTNLLHYNNKASGTSDGSRTVSSVFGNGQPIKLTVDVTDVKKAESFNDKVAKSNVLDLLNTYESKGSGSTTHAQSGYDLQNQMNSKPTCKTVDLNDYVHRRVGQCNCQVT